MVLVLPQATVVSLGVDPMLLDLDLFIRLCSMLYLSLDRHRPVLDSRVGIVHSLSCSKLSQWTDHLW